MNVDESTQVIQPGSFESHDHWYPKALNAAIHPMINFFLNLDNKLIIDRYCHLHPKVKAAKLLELISYQPLYYNWSGADLINVTNARGKRQMVVIENNSCPSGQKSMPLKVDTLHQGSYRELIEKSFQPYSKIKKLNSNEAIAVLYDKNVMETSGYAATMADVFQQPVYLVPFYDGANNDHIRYKNHYIEILDERNKWKQVVAAFRYVTQKPWNRIPVSSKTRIYNPIIACLAGGRNKLIASKAYDQYNGEIDRMGLKIRTPETIWDVQKDEVPLWVKRMGGQAVIKVPYSNAGQGVYTIVNESELNDFLSRDYEYSKFIVQSLIGNYRWSSRTESGKFFHLGTIPNAKGETYVFDLRMMICATPLGFRPVCVYSRRANSPLTDTITEGTSSWDMLGTNLSHKDTHGQWTTDTNRLILMDRRDFNHLGMGLDDLIEAYIQTILSTIAIDKMACRLVNSRGQFNSKLFASFNDDPYLIREIMLEA
ncbi:MAG: hypothetical protein IPP15_02390 [Saprospiraceae bacterium]|uniref:Uncharacterized protein n=1 Tax=Candidatus Opimibacter skivensis TaxID=2982028 RepID=A0A9D7SSE6_9BACT|nr:hypothetical protein [Candidatus Opimibacter skivensis]